MLGEKLFARKGRNLVLTDSGRIAFRYADENFGLAAGIIDPTKVVRAALQNAASVASIMLTTEALIAGIAA